MGSRPENAVSGPVIKIACRGRLLAESGLGPMLKERWGKEARYLYPLGGAGIAHPDPPQSDSDPIAPLALVVGESGKDTMQIL
jgi:hypothetical protein